MTDQKHWLQWIQWKGSVRRVTQSNLRPHKRPSSNRFRFELVCGHSLIIGRWTVNSEHDCHEKKNSWTLIDCCFQVSSFHVPTTRDISHSATDIYIHCGEKSVPALTELREPPPPLPPRSPAAHLYSVEENIWKKLKGTLSVQAETDFTWEKKSLKKKKINEDNRSKQRSRLKEIQQHHINNKNLQSFVFVITVVSLQQVCQNSL